MYTLNASSFCGEYSGIIILMLNFIFSPKILRKHRKVMKTRFHYFSLIAGRQNLVSSFLTSFPRGIFRNIPEKSNPPSEKNYWNSAILTFIWSPVGTRFHYFPVIVGQPNLVSSFLTSFPRGVWRNIPEKSNPPSEKTVEISIFDDYLVTQLVQHFTTFQSS